ncbi:MAG: iron complex transport system ATP-binding protein [Arenicella sp.]|jgi:iron complex transport system ATP-binding protein
MKTRLLDIDEVCIQVRGSNKSHSHSVLVNSVSCHVNAGEVLAIIGPNGAGKSTLLNAIAGDIAFTGTISIEGVAEQARLRARQIAVLPQLSLLSFPYRVSEVVGLARIPHNTGRQRDDEIVQEALTLMDIGYLSERLYTELSGGEKQRVQLARVFAQIWQKGDAPNGSRLLLLDEPTAALDLGHQKQLMIAIRELAKHGVAVVMVLHDINLAARYADRALAMLCSERLAFGSIKDVINQQNIKSLFEVDVHIAQHPEHDCPVVIGL